MDNPTTAQKKFVSYLKKRDPSVTDKDIPHLLSSFKRFVKVVQKIYTEPQAQVTIKDFKENGKNVRKKVFTTDIKELKKVFDKKEGPHDLLEVMRKLDKSLNKDKYDR